MDQIGQNKEKKRKRRMCQKYEQWNGRFLKGSLEVGRMGETLPIRRVCESYVRVEG